MLNIILGLLGGLFIGYSIGIGFITNFKQPKNLIIQIIMATISLILLTFLFLNLK